MNGRGTISSFQLPLAVAAKAAGSFQYVLTQNFSDFFNQVVTGAGMRGQDCIRSELRLGRRRDKSAHHNLIYFNSFTDSAVIRGPFENVAQLLLLQAKRTGIWIQTLHD